MKTITNKETGEITEYTDAEFIEKRDALLLQWQDAQKRLEVAKAEEMVLRKQCVDFAFDQDKISGTERVELGGGWEAKAVKKLTYGFIQDKEGKLDRKAINAALDKIEARSDAGAYIAENLVKWTPALSVTEYNKLNPEDKAAIDAVIVTKEGAPTLEIIAPKAPKA